ncbi:MAG: class I SAM-dependent methyltransferase [Acidobacteriaceae bacterium]
MPIGPLIRSIAGPWEHQLAELYRRIFVDLDDFARLLQSWVPQSRRILEVGCGEGAMTERLVRTYPLAAITAIDITPRIGRLYQGDRSSVTFAQESVESVAARQAASFDLIVLADVLHHVPIPVRSSLLAAARQSLAPGGALVFKDWIVTRTPIHWLSNFSDTRLTGDSVSYFTLTGIEAMLAEAFGPGAIRQFAPVRPWRNNVAFLVQPSEVSTPRV